MISNISKSGFLTIALLFFVWLVDANAQPAKKTVLRGIVLEDKTGLYIPYAVIVVDGTSEGTSSDPEGMFVLQTSHPSPKLKVSCIGYNPLVINVPVGFTGPLTIKLTPQTITLNEVVVKAGRIKYRNKDNPAVSLIDSVIANKQKNRIENFDYLQYEKYEKVQFSLSNISESIKKSKLLNKVNFYI